MINHYHKTLLILVTTAVLLPMLLLVLIATCDFTIVEVDNWWHTAVRRISVVIIVLWLFNLMLLVVTLSIKELLLGYFSSDLTLDENEESSLTENEVILKNKENMKDQ